MRALAGRSGDRVSMHVRTCIEQHAALALVPRTGHGGGLHAACRCLFFMLHAHPTLASRVARRTQLSVHAKALSGQPVLLRLAVDMEVEAEADVAAPAPPSPEPPSPVPPSPRPSKRRRPPRGDRGQGR